MSSKILTLIRMVMHPPNLNNIHLNSALSPLTLWKADLSLAYHGLPAGLWFVTAHVNKLVRLAFEWRSRNSEIMIMVLNRLLYLTVSCIVLQRYPDISTPDFPPDE